MSMPHDAPLYPSLPRYYRDVDIVSIICETDEANVATTLPPPLQPVGQSTNLFEVKFSHYANTVLGTFNEASVLVPARFGDLACYTFTYIYIDNIAGLVAGRELMGFPKKDGLIDFQRDGDRFSAQVMRNGKLLMRMTCDLGKPKDVKRAVGTRLTVRDIPRADGPGLEQRQVIRKDFNPNFFTVHDSRSGEATVELFGTEDDPLQKLGKFRVVGGHYQHVDFSLEWGQILYTENYPRENVQSPLATAR